MNALDEKDSAILEQRTANWNERGGPRVGDFALLADGRRMRFSHDWGDALQVSEGGSFYFGDGYCQFSGGLEPAISKAAFVETPDSIMGEAWIFHHDSHRAHNGVNVTIPCRVYRQVTA